MITCFYLSYSLGLESLLERNGMEQQEFCQPFRSDILALWKKKFVLFCVIKRGWDVAQSLILEDSEESGGMGRDTYGDDVS
jgi:hypothetical protein